MTEKDFVIAWMLAHRTAIPDTLLTDLAISQLLAQAKKIYNLIEQEYSND